MKTKIFSSLFVLCFILVSCTKEYECADNQIQPAFINFDSSDIDSFVIRKFKRGDNFQNLIDTFIVRDGFNSFYQTSNDTTTVRITDGENGVKPGFDWQIFIPSKNKTVFISDIVSEKKIGKRNLGIFSMDPGPGCTNDIFSAKIDNQVINFTSSEFSSYYVYIPN